MPTPFRRLPYAEAMAQYGSDKPDLRFGAGDRGRQPTCGPTPLQRLPHIVSSTAAPCGRSWCPARARYSRSELDALVEQAKQLGAVGILWARQGEGAVNTNVKAAGEHEPAAIDGSGRCGDADLILLAGGEADAASKLLGAFRLSLAKKET